ncbi:MAG: LysR family transcriptional regulator [Erysipelotrichaceae bacterium]|nr:LysR family transcriptional regulator [Erysipelotrichaceae bacterium]
MIEIHQLEQLICIADSGNISKAAEKLHISQPALSRSMQRLEDDLEVQIFDHYVNKVVLNENGGLVVKRAKEILSFVDSMISEVQDFNKRNQVISVASCTPAPIWDLDPLIKEIYPNINITSKILDKDELVDALKSKEYTMVVTPFEVNDKDIICVPYIEEDLCLSLPSTHHLANKEELSFHDMDGETMLLYSNIGFWYDMHIKDMPNTKFLFQDDRNTFIEVVKASSLPSFTSNLSIKREGVMKNRIIIPFSDDNAHVTFFVNILKEDKQRYQGLINKIENYYDY